MKHPYYCAYHDESMTKREAREHKKSCDGVLYTFYSWGKGFPEKRQRCRD